MDTLYEQALEPARKRTGLDLQICSLSEFLSDNTATSNTLSRFPDIIDSSSPRFHEVLGSYLIFQAKIFDQINLLSEPFAAEGYGMQGSRMYFHRSTSVVINHFKQVLHYPEKNLFLIVVDKKTRKIFGSVSILNNNKGPPELADFYLSEELRRHKTDPKVGIAKYLLIRAMSFARNLGHKEIFLSSRRKGGFEAALNLFSQIGFREMTDNRRISKLVSHKYQSPKTIAMIFDSDSIPFISQN